MIYRNIINILLMGMFIFLPLINTAKSQISIIKADPNDPVFTKMRMLEFTFDYNPKLVHFEHASSEMIKAVLGDRVNYEMYDNAGHTYKIPVDLISLPYWIYASYSAKERDKICSYILVDGFSPELFDGEPNKPQITDKVTFQEVDLNAAVLRNCGDRFEVISQENFDNFFDEPFHIPFNNPNSSEIASKAVVENLAKNYIQNLIKAFGGKDNLQKKFNEGKEINAYGFSFNDISRPLKEELLKAGIVDPEQKKN